MKSLGFILWGTRTNAWTKFHRSSSNSCGDIWAWIKVVDKPTDWHCCPNAFTSINPLLYFPLHHFLFNPWPKDTVSLLSVKTSFFYGLSGTFSNTVLLTSSTFDQIMRGGWVIIFIGLIRPGIEQGWHRNWYNMETMWSPLSVLFLILRLFGVCQAQTDITRPLLKPCMFTFACPELRDVALVSRLLLTCSNLILSSNTIT